LCKSKNILGSMVMDLEKAKNYGRVRDIIFDLKKQKVVAIIIPGKNWLYAPRWIDFEFVRGCNDVISLSPDVKIYTVRKASSSKEWLQHSIRKLWGLHVVSHKGKIIGTLEDIYLHVPGGSLRGIELSLGLISDIYAGRKFVPAEEIELFSEEAVVIKNDI